MAYCSSPVYVLLNPSIVFHSLIKCDNATLPQRFPMPLGKMTFTRDIISQQRPSSFQIHGKTCLQMTDRHAHTKLCRLPGLLCTILQTLTTHSSSIPSVISPKMANSIPRYWVLKTDRLVMAVGRFFFVNRL